MVDDRDFVFKYWPEQALMEDICSPEAYISTHNDNHHNLFATSLHHAANSRMPHHQQDRLGMPGPSYYAPGSPNAAFFQMPTPKMSTLPGPSGLSPSSTTTTATTTAAAAAPHHYRQESPTSTHSDRSHSKQRSSARSTDGDECDDEAQAAIKRQRNTMAARKYRQKRLDRIADLERALSDMAGERDELKLKLARREAEVEALREVLGKR
ncbi:hypothetical protein BBK36DRAFT_1169461 [Trichoderma citrinoviride]|uniref:BZIP domain-containing protein n=1 Tax=Trichoderma citrinoviride TaxID=58853 RepID=A0A2T4B8V9_9HYPO|nr:hypothetical protein BBK36DRAFT_1169461 [Trichoderma citrinoviride]PTB65767.1 hypothetical protein BBK36DRAFT_1169461 [Trichoderma citrinoviride]